MRQCRVKQVYETGCPLEEDLRVRSWRLNAKEVYFVLAELTASIQNYKVIVQQAARYSCLLTCLVNVVF